MEIKSQLCIAFKSSPDLKAQVSVSDLSDLSDPAFFCKHFTFSTSKQNPSEENRAYNFKMSKKLSYSTTVSH